MTNGPVMTTSSDLLPETPKELTHDDRATLGNLCLGLSCVSLFGASSLIWAVLNNPAVGSDLEQGTHTAHMQASGDGAVLLVLFSVLMTITGCVCKPSTWRGIVTGLLLLVACLIGFASLLALGLSR